MISFSFKRQLLLLYVVIVGLASVSCDEKPGDKYGYGDGKSSNALLINLVLSEGELNYPFSPFDWSYSASVGNEVESITVTPVVDHVFAVAFVNGQLVQSAEESESINLDVGENDINVHVVAWDGSENNYSVTVIRRVSENANLASLAISSSDNPDITFFEKFDPNTTRYSVVVDGSTDVISLSCVAEKEGSIIMMEKAGSGKVNDPKEISITQGLNRILITVTAPDGNTNKYYIVSVTQLSGVLDDYTVSSVFIENTTLDPIFDPENQDTFDATAAISGGKLPTNLYVLTQSTATMVGITIDGGTPLVNGPSAGITILKLTEDIIPIRETPYQIAITITKGNGNDSKTYNIELTVRSGNNDADLSNIQLYWGSNDSQRVIYPGTFNTHDPQVYGFDPNILDYMAVMYATETVKIEAVANDPNVTNVFINGNGTHTSGAVNQHVSLNKGYITDVVIDVLAEDGATSKQYNLRVKLLNEYEFYWGIYGILNMKAFDRWEDIFGDQGIKKVTIPGLLKGNLVWEISLQGLRPLNEMTWTNYLDGNRGTSQYDMRVDYNDNHNTDNQYHGFCLAGYVSGLLDGISSKNGIQTGGFDLSSPWGDHIARIDVHYIVQGGKKIIDPDSYIWLDYMDVTDIKMMYMDTQGFDPFKEPGYDWENPWIPEGYPKN